MLFFKFVCLCFTVLSSQYVEGLQDIGRSVLNLPKITSQNNSLQGIAWTQHDFKERAIDAISVCVWLKSADLHKTGTLFAYVGIQNIMQFGLVSFERPRMESNPRPNQSILYDVHLVIAGHTASKTIPLRLDDVIWHDVCMTWDTSGSWKVFVDGIVAEQGERFQINQEISMKDGILFLGSGGKMRRERDQFGVFRNLASFTGKITGLRLWRSSLTAKNVAELSDCNSHNHPPDTTEQLRNAIIYNWSVDDITTLWPASFFPNEDVCEREITVECTQDHMFVSLSRKRFLYSSLPYSNLRLNDPNCLPSIRGSSDNRYVFDVTDYSSCGTQRQVTDKEVIYSNRVTNSPHNTVVFGHIRFEAEVRCHFPIDLTISSRLLDMNNEKKLHFKTSMINPRTNEEDVEAIVYLFKDEAFTQVFAGSADLDPSGNAYVGLVVKNKMTQDAADDVNVVVDTCWVTSQTHKRQIIANNGCWVASDGINVLENGRKSQARIKISSGVFALLLGPLFLQCSVYTCLGDTCAPSCGENKTVAFKSITSDILPPNKNKITKRDISSQNRDYEIIIGPVNVKDSHSNNQSDDRKHNSSHSFITLPILIIVICLLSFIIVCCLLFTAAFLWKKKKRSGDYDITGNYGVKEPVEAKRHNQRKNSDFSIPSLSSSITSSVNSLSSTDSYEFISVSQQFYHHTI